MAYISSLYKLFALLNSTRMNEWFWRFMGQTKMVFGHSLVRKQAVEYRRVLRPDVKSKHVQGESEGIPA